MIEACPECGERAPMRARFCVACGFDLEMARVRAERARERDGASRVARSIAIVFIGTLAALVATPFLSFGRAELQPLVWTVLLACPGLLATRVLGPGALPLSFGRPAGVLGIAWGIGAGLLGFSLSLAIVSAMRHWLGCGAPVPDAHVGLAILGVVVLPALVEEWLCRGVLWLALRRAVGTGGTTLCTAV